MLRHISTRADISKFSPATGPSYLFVDLEGPGGALSNTINLAMTLDVARQIGAAAGESPQATLDAIAFWYESHIAGPVFGTQSSIELHRAHRRAAALQFAEKLAKAFPSILRGTPHEDPPST